MNGQGSGITVTTEPKNITWRLVTAAGGRTRVARRFGISKNAVSEWIGRDTIPAHYVVDLCQLVGGDQFQPHQLRPDVFLTPGAALELANRQGVEL